MTRTTQRAVVTIIALSLIACTSLQQLPQTNVVGASRAHRQAQGIVIGDTLKISPKNAEAFELVVTGVDPDSIVGTQDGKATQILLVNIESIEQKRFDLLRTTLLIVGLGLIALGQYARGVSKLANP